MLYDPSDWQNNALVSLFIMTDDFPIGLVDRPVYLSG